MSLFSTELFTDQLSKLTNNKQDLDILSSYIILNKDEVDNVLPILENELRTVTYSKKLTIFYLTHEILLKIIAEDLGKEFFTIFKKFILRNFSKIEQRIENEELRKKFDDLKKIWINKKIFKETDLKTQLRQTTIKKFSEKEVLEKIKEYFQKKRELKKYLEEFIDNQLK